MSKSTIVEVTLTKLFIIDSEDEKYIKELMDEWFSKKYLRSSHVYRDSCASWGYNSFLGYKIKDKIDI